MKNLLLTHNEGPLSIPSVWGIKAPYHPAVLYFESPWNGYKYWMAETPFPLTSNIYRDRFECPCIHVSDDGIHWKDLVGLVNPIVDLSEQEISDFDFYSDPHLLMHNNTMECWYRITRRRGKNEYYTADAETFLLRMTTKDGLNWSKPEVLISLTKMSNAELVSPAVIFENNCYQLWMVRVDKSCDNYTVVRLTSSDAKRWTCISECDLIGIDFHPWHIDIKHFDNRYQLVVFGLNSPRSLSLWQSCDGHRFEKILEFPISTGHHGSFYEQRLYRAALCKVSDSDYRLYFSANDSASTHIGLLQGNNLNDMSIINVDNKSYRSLCNFFFYIIKKVICRISIHFHN